MAEKLVWIDEEGYVNVRDPNWEGFIYDFTITDAMPIEHWIRQLSQKNWVTDEHLRQLRDLEIAA
jgi:hypothetical protein